MSFGFGIGDFLAVSTLAVRAYNSFQDRTGSKADYQSLKMMRQSVGITLAQAQNNLKFDPECFPASLSNTINNHLDSCFRALKAFDDMTQKYEEMLSPAVGARKKMKHFCLKLKWNTTKSGAREFFNDIAKHIDAIQLLLDHSNMQITSRLDKRTEVMSEALIRMEKNSVPPSLVTWNPDYSPIKFMDALERNFVFDYTLCDTWDKLQKLIIMCFENDPEHKFVVTKAFSILNENKNGETVEQNDWESVRSPGMFISMALRKKVSVSPSASEDTIYCPACNAPQTDYRNLAPAARIRCRKCCKWFDNVDTRYVKGYNSAMSRGLLEITDADNKELDRVRRWQMVKVLRSGLATGLFQGMGRAFSRNRLAR
ncbi:hypothetical protein BZA77DRAFT_384929 [Pyronema omphalodes]|nr:hypothetical protein BZA77DRAFT_384929 [Pyronema omphalodes]